MLDDLRYCAANDDSSEEVHRIFDLVIVVEAAEATVVIYYLWMILIDLVSLVDLVHSEMRKGVKMSFLELSAWFVVAPIPDSHAASFGELARLLPIDLLDPDLLLQQNQVYQCCTSEVDRYVEAVVLVVVAARMDASHQPLAFVGPLDERGP